MDFNKLITLKKKQNKYRSQTADDIYFITQDFFKLSGYEMHFFRTIQFNQTLKTFKQFYLNA